MKLDHIFDHHNAVSEWDRRGLSDWLADILEAPGIKVLEGQTTVIRDHARQELEKAGWEINAKVDENIGLSVFALKDDLAIHIQTGNISRAAYDLLKLQYLYQNKTIQAAALLLPSKECAMQLGSNIADADRVSKELQLFDRIITIPICVVAFS